MDVERPSGFRRERDRHNGSLLHNVVAFFVRLYISAGNLYGLHNHMVELGNRQRLCGGRLIRTDLARKCDDIAHAYVAYGRDGRSFGRNDRTKPL